VSRRDNRHLRCATCRMHASLCICGLVRRVETRTRLVLLIHYCEDRKPTNTGRLATLCLPNSEVIVRGKGEQSERQPEQPLAFAPDTQPLLLFPHEGATPLAELARPDRPVTLIVPDGNWRQAFKVRSRVPGLRDVPCVFLPPTTPSIYRLRTETHAAGLATIEAIARAFGILEGREVEDALELVFRAMVERTLWSRGQCRTEDVTGGVPEGAMRHDPRSGLARQSRATSK
jgi:DTW domain-containing protein YfiP